MAHPVTKPSLPLLLLFLQQGGSTLRHKSWHLSSGSAPAVGSLDSMDPAEQQQRQPKQQEQPAAPPVAQQQAQAATSWPPPLAPHALLRHQQQQSGSQLMRLDDPPAAAAFWSLAPAADGAATRPAQAATSEPLPPVPPSQQQHSRRRHSYSTSAGPSTPLVTAAAAAPSTEGSTGPMLAAARRPASAPPSPVLQGPQASQADSHAAGHDIPRGGSPPVLPKPKKVRLQLAGSSGRMLWTAELHDLFLAAVAQRGGAESATPNEILQIMNVEGLSRENVKSHLQKHRQQVRELRLLHNMQQMQTNRGVSQSLHQQQQQQQQQQPVLVGNLSLLAASQAAAAAAGPGHEQQASSSAAAAAAALGAAVQGLGWQHGQQGPSSSSSESSIDKQGKLQQQQHVHNQQQISRPSGSAVHPQQQLVMQHKQEVSANKTQVAAAAAPGGGVAADRLDLEEAAADELSGLQVLSTVAEEAGQLLEEDDGDDDDDDDDVCMRDSSPMQHQEPSHHQEAAMSAAAHHDTLKQHMAVGVSAAPLQACQCAVCQRRVIENRLAAEQAVKSPDSGAAAELDEPPAGGASNSAMQVLSAALLVLDPATRARLAAVLQLLTVQGVISWHDPPQDGPGQAPRDCARLLQAAMTQHSKR